MIKRSRFAIVGDVPDTARITEIKLPKRGWLEARSEALPPNARVLSIQPDTMHEGSDVRARFESVRVGMTVTEILSLKKVRGLGPSRFDLTTAIARERISLSTGPPEGTITRSEAQVLARLQAGATISEAVNKGVGKSTLLHAINRGLIVLEDGEVQHDLTAFAEEFTEDDGVVTDPGQSEADPEGREPAPVYHALCSPIEDQVESHCFSREHQLRDFIANNLGGLDINGRRLCLYNDENGVGVEYRTAAGLIDILAVDREGTFYVFELKLTNSFDRVMGQLTRYMGWVNETIGKGKKAHGIIVAQSISDKLKFARKAVPNVHLYEYDIALNLKQAHEHNVGLD